MSEPSAAYRQAVHETLLLDNEITRAINLYREVNREHFNAAEMADLRKHYQYLGQLPELLRMLNEEVEIIKIHGPRRVSWWDLIDEE